MMARGNLSEEALMPLTWLAKLITERDAWLTRRSGRRIEEALDRVQLFEREALVVEVWVEDGKIERAKAAALTIAIDRDQHLGALA